MVKYNTTPLCEWRAFGKTEWPASFSISDLTLGGSLGECPPSVQSAELVELELELERVLVLEQEQVAPSSVVVAVDGAEPAGAVDGVAVAASAAADADGGAFAVEQETWAWSGNLPEDGPQWHSHRLRDFGSHRSATRLIPVCGLNNEICLRRCYLYSAQKGFDSHTEIGAGDNDSIFFLKFKCLGTKSFQTLRNIYTGKTNGKRRVKRRKGKRTMNSIRTTRGRDRYLQLAATAAAEREKS